MFRAIRLNDKRIILQYMIRYGLVILITSVLMLILLNWVLRDYKESLVDDANKELQLCLQELDEFLGSQNEVARKIYLNNLSNPQYMLKNSRNAKAGTEQVSLYQEALEVNDYILLCYDKEQYFIQEGELAKDTMLNDVLRLDDSSKNLFREAINDHSSDSMIVLTDKSGSTMLLCLYPMLNYLSESEDMIGFIIRGDSLQHYLLESIKDKVSYARMQWASGEVLFDINSLSGDKALANDNTNEVYRSNYGYELRYLLVNDHFLINYNKIMVLVVCFAVLIVLFAIIAMSLVNYVNVRNIISVRDDLLQSDDYGTDEISDNELWQIRYMINRMNRKRKRNGFVREQILQILCGGLVQREEVLEDIVKRMCPGLLGRNYLVLSVINCAPKEDCLEILAEFIATDACIIGCADDSGLLTFVLGCDDAEKTLQRRIGEKLLLKAEAKNETGALVVIGRVCDRLCEISGAYRGIVGMISCVLTDEEIRKKRVWLYEDIVEECREYLFEEKHLRDFQKAMIDGNMAEMERSLESLLKLERGENNELLCSFKRGMLTELLCELLQSQEIGITQINKLRGLPVEDEKKYKSGVLAVMKKCCMENDPIEDILGYINENFRDNTMGLEVLAARHHMSVPVLSSYIKERCGKKYTEYISELRLKEACRLLRETDLKLQDIPGKIGYDDYVSFSKKFKAAVGATPANYRNQNKI